MSTVDAPPEGISESAPKTSLLNLFLRERRSRKEKSPINDKGQQIEQRYVYFFHVKLLIMTKMWFSSICHNSHSLGCLWYFQLHLQDLHLTPRFLNVSLFVLFLVRLGTANYYKSVPTRSLQALVTLRLKAFCANRKFVLSCSCCELHRFYLTVAFVFDRRNSSKYHARKGHKNYNCPGGRG